MSKIVYAWAGEPIKARRDIQNVDVQVAGERIEKIRNELGGFFKPKDVVSDARSKNSPLHNAFEWDNKKAADKYRVVQAQLLIRSIVVIMNPGTKKERIIKSFVNITKKVGGRGRQRYTSIGHAMGQKELRNQILQKAWDELVGWNERYQDYEEFSNVYSEIGKAGKALSKARKINIVVKRNCLKCDKVFESAGPHNRKCDNCRQEKAA